MRRIFEAVYQVFFDKKWGILIKMESESLMYSGLEIPRDYFNIKGEVLWIGFKVHIVMVFVYFQWKFYKIF